MRIRPKYRNFDCIPIPLYDTFTGYTQMCSTYLFVIERDFQEARPLRVVAAQWAIYFQNETGRWPWLFTVLGLSWVRIIADYHCRLSTRIIAHIQSNDHLIFRSGYWPCDRRIYYSKSWSEMGLHHHRK